MIILAIDGGTTQSGYCRMTDDNDGDYTLLEFGKIDNEKLLEIVENAEYDEMVYEQFQSYNMPVGKSTILSVEWNGRFVQAAYSRKKPYSFVYRVEEKMHFCNSVKAKDTNIRKALIERYAKFDFKSGHGTKKNPDYFYGVSNDAWSGIAICVLRFDRINRKDGSGNAIE